MSATEASSKQEERDQSHVPDFDLFDSELDPVTNSQYYEMDQLDADLPSIDSKATCINSSN